MLRPSSRSGKFEILTCFACWDSVDHHLTLKLIKIIIKTSICKKLRKFSLKVLKSNKKYILHPNIWDFDQILRHKTYHKAILKWLSNIESFCSPTRPVHNELNFIWSPSSSFKSYPINTEDIHFEQSFYTISFLKVEIILNYHWKRTRMQTRDA